MPESYVIQQSGRIALRFLANKLGCDEGRVVNMLNYRVPIVYSRSADRWTATIDGKVVTCETSEMDIFDSTISTVVVRREDLKVIDTYDLDEQTAQRVIMFLLRTYVRTDTYPVEISIPQFDYYKLPTTADVNTRRDISGGPPRVIGDKNTIFYDYIIKLDGEIRDLLSFIK